MDEHFFQNLLSSFDFLHPATKYLRQILKGTLWRLKVDIMIQNCLHHGKRERFNKEALCMYILVGPHFQNLCPTFLIFNAFVFHQYFFVRILLSMLFNWKDLTSLTYHFPIDLLASFMHILQVALVYFTCSSSLFHVTVLFFRLSTVSFSLCFFSTLFLLFA